MFNKLKNFLHQKFLRPFFIFSIVLTTLFLVVSFNYKIAEAAPCQITSFSASPTAVAVNGTSTLTWTTSGTCNTPARIYGYTFPGGNVIVPLNGSISSGPLNGGSATYTLVIPYQNGFRTQSLVVTVTCPIVIPSSGGVVRYYEDSFNGGVTGAGYSPSAYTYWAGSIGNIVTAVPPGSTIRKALLIASRNGCAPNLTVNLNGLPFTFNPANQASPTFQTPYTYPTADPWYITGDSASHVIDVTAAVASLNTNNYSLVIPGQITGGHLLGSNTYSDFYLLVAFENLSMPTVYTEVFLNTINSQYSVNHTLNFINPINTAYPVAYAVMAGWQCSTNLNTIYEDTERVTVGTQFLGTTKGPDMNSSDPCAGPHGDFSYYNNTIFGLSDDTPNTTMFYPDVLANIQNFITNNTTSFNTNFTTTMTATMPQTTIQGNTTDPIWAEFVAYGGPPLPLNCVTGLNETNLTSNSVTLNWTNNPPYVGGLALRYRPASSSVWIPANTWSAISAATNTWNLSSLIPGTQYDWQLVPEMCPMSAIRTFQTLP